MRRVDARGDHGHPDPPVQRLIDRRSEDDVRFFVDLVADARHGLIDLEQGQILAAGDVDQQALGAAHAGVFQQWVVDRGLGRADGAVVAVGLPGAHHGLTHLEHDRFDIGEIEVDEPVHHHQIGDAAHAHIKDLVGHLERFLPGGAFGGHTEQILVRDHDQRIDVLLQFLDALIGCSAAAEALEPEGFGHHADGQDAALLRHAGDDGGRPGAGAAAHAGGDEHHVGAVQMAEQFVGRFFRRRLADFRLRTRAQTLGQMRPKLDSAIGSAVHQLLRVGVRDHEIDALQVGGDHVVDRVRATATDTDHGDPGGEIGVRLWRYDEIQCHGFVPPVTMG